MKKKATATQKVSKSSTEKPSLDDEVSKAFESVTVTKFRTEELHSNWRAHLFRLSIGVVFLTMHQYSQPVRDCIVDIKSVQPDVDIDNVTAMKLIFSDGLVELINFIIAILQMLFLANSTEKKTFTAKFYCATAALVPFCLGLYFNTKRTGCMIDSNGSIVIRTEDATNQLSERQFPVSILFHLIVTGCVYFMSIGMEQVDKNLAAVELLRDQLLHTNKKKSKTSKKND